jgi:hypothetical protein
LIVRKHLLIAAASLLALPGIASAIGVGVIGGDPPGLVTTDLGEVQATGVEPCPSPNTDPSDFCYVFNNNTGGIITSLSFSADIAMNLPTGSDGLPTNNGVDVFACTQVGQFVEGYFLGCNITYDSTTGALTFLFSGVNPPQGAEVCPSGNCAPSQRGIPPDTIPTDPEFTIELLAWTGDATAQMGPDSPPVDVFIGGVVPVLTNTFTATPEPSTLAFLAIAFLLTAGAAQLRRRKLMALRRSA